MRDYGVRAHTLRAVKVSFGSTKSFDDIVSCARLHGGACGDESFDDKIECARSCANTAVVATTNISACTLKMMNVRFKNKDDIFICGLIDTGCTSDLFHADVTGYINVLSAELVSL